MRKWIMTCPNRGKNDLLLDTEQVAREHSYGPKIPYISFRPVFSKEKRIDSSFVNSLIDAHRHIIFDGHKGTTYPSAYLPVVTEIRFKK